MIVLLTAILKMILIICLCFVMFMIIGIYLTIKENSIIKKKLYKDLIKKYGKDDARRWLNGTFDENVNKKKDV